jgi:hypothetical protein
MEEPERVAGAKVYFNGAPTGPDVRRLMDKWPKIKANDAFTYEEVEAVIEYKRDEYRFKSIVTAWRKKLYGQYNIILECIPTVGYEALDGSGRINKASKTLNYGLRRVRRAWSVAATTEKAQLTAGDMAACDHVVRTSALLLNRAKEEARKIKFNLPEIEHRDDGADKK